MILQSLSVIIDGQTDRTNQNGQFHLRVEKILQKIFQSELKVMVINVSMSCVPLNTDTLTEGGRGESGSTYTVHVLPQLL